MNIFAYFPAINSFWGLILYSLVAYIVATILAGIVSSYMVNPDQFDQQKKKIIKQREVKDKKAQELLKKLS
ncbi:unnamed protein product [Paramecium pentaurelia]|uniref:Uncharacterized protein n=1 Tax=Paramecium pentaurelia TaxID=43138 RepID=A0A8S1VVX8_9CILI|nr:unnamed protein product [Paramecium pentaurelia]